MMMKATPTASFKMAETQFLFQFLIIALDDPALFAQGDQIAQPAVFRQIGHPVLSGFGFLTGPLDQQPFLFSRLAELVIAMCGANAVSNTVVLGTFNPPSTDYYRRR